MFSDKLGEELVGRYDKIVQMRQGNWDSYFRYINQYVRPLTPEFGTNNYQDRGKVYNPNTYDGTALYAQQQLTSSLHSSFLPHNDVIFKLRWENKALNNDAEARFYLDEVEEIIHMYYNFPESYYAQSVHEFLADLTSFGTGVLYEEWVPSTRHLRYRSIPLANCYILSDAFGYVDTIYVLYKMSVRAAMNYFGQENLHHDYAKQAQDLDEVIDIVHCVYPNNDYNPNFPAHKSNKPYVSYWFDRQMKKVISSGGYDTFPYHVARWAVMAGETYGRSPAMTCLSDIKMLNAMSYVVIKVAQKTMDPPLVVPNQGFVLPLSTRPGSFLYKEPYAGDIQQLDIRSNHQLSLELMQSIQQHILRCFFVDYVNLQKNNIEMTAYEVQDRRMEQTALMSPNLGRVQAEWLQPNVMRSYRLLKNAGELPELPRQLRGARIRVESVSPAKQAFAAGKLMTYRRFLESIQPMAAIDNSVLHRIKLDEVSADMAELSQLSQKVVRTPEELQEYRKGLEEQLAQQQQAQMGAQMAGAYRDFAEGQAALRA